MDELAEVSVMAEINSYGARVCLVGTDGRIISVPTEKQKG